MSYRSLSAVLSLAGWPIPEMGIRRIEAGARRVTVDDLSAISAALNVSPMDLLVGPDPAPLPTGLPADFKIAEGRAWMRGDMQTLLLIDRFTFWLEHSIRLRDEKKQLEAILENDEAPAHLRAYAEKEMRRVRSSLEVAEDVKKDLVLTDREAWERSPAEGLDKRIKDAAQAYLDAEDKDSSDG